MKLLGKCSYIFIAIAALSISTLNATQREDQDVVINEICYKAHDDFDTGDWVELYNRSTQAIDISQWQFKDEDDQHIFELPDNTIMEADSYLVLYKDSLLFNALYPDLENAIGPIGFGFAGGGELLRLYNSDATIVDSVMYDDEGDWPTEADGNGSTLELINAYSDNYLAASWRASVGSGTPGSINTATPNSNNEVMLPEIVASAYPNPFSLSNESATINYKLANNSIVDISIYNIKGQLVKNLTNSYESAGDNSVQWNGLNANNKRVSSGIYFARINTETSTISTKIVVLK